jgi:hypothetical protein
MTPESQNSSLLGNGLVKYIPTKANIHNNNRAMFSVVCATLVAMQWCGKHIPAAVNQHTTTEEAVFSVGAALRLYNGDLTQLELELSQVPEFQVSS